MIMNIEEALLKAIEFENGVYGIYGEALDTATNQKAIKIYTLMQQDAVYRRKGVASVANLQKSYVK
jgi:hypothetical protein